MYPKINKNFFNLKLFRSSHPEVFLEKGVPKIYIKFTGEHPCQSVISIKLQSRFIEITLPHECSPLNLLHIFRTPFPRNTSEWLLLTISIVMQKKIINNEKNPREILIWQQILELKNIKLYNFKLNLYKI